MDTSKIVGEKIKSLRESQSISMEELAQRSGLAIEQIERIENNIDLPSLAPLIKIARVLGVRLGTFLDDQDENGPVVCRKDESLPHLHPRPDKTRQVYIPFSRSCAGFPPRHWQKAYLRYL